MSAGAGDGGGNLIFIKSLPQTTLQRLGGRSGARASMRRGGVSGGASGCVSVCVSAEVVGVSGGASGCVSVCVSTEVVGVSVYVRVSFGCLQATRKATASAERWYAMVRQAEWDRRKERRT